MAQSTNSRSMAYFTEAGYICKKVEIWNPYDKKRHDLFGFIDTLALGHGELLAIQACGASDYQAHRRKIIAETNALLWLIAGNSIVLQSWRKKKLKRGGVAFTWVPTTVLITEASWELFIAETKGL